MLKVVVDATPVDSKPSGVGFYVANLIRSLDALQSQEKFQLEIAYQPGFKNWLSGKLALPDCLNQNSSIHHILPIPVRISDLFLTSTQASSLFLYSFQNYLEQCFDYPDILHGTNYSVYPCNNSLKVMNIYDLTFIKYPNYIDSVVKTYTKRVKHCLQWTDLVLTISESSKKDIIEYLEVDPQKIYVTPLASRYHLSYLSEEIVEKLEKQAKYDFSKPYLLFVSTIEPRKNINNIIKAFNFLKQKYKIEHHLILIGKKGWNYEPIFMAIDTSPWKHEIHHLDYLSDKLVALFYSKADVFVYPSHYEGFGLPVLEAMTLGAPVVTANTSSLPEVTGDAAILIDPNDFIQLAEAILKIINDCQFRQELINKGQERAKLFSWERTAKETLKAYRDFV
ncbi:glycosyltransferase family 4 protein [aff. Roholtiella sp. LEGE 12411]|uniref:glycosyltransferase family 4 protein n=1 Tax=aff. Roholtiella sp. LEGE 12411 TaxID=1828822 RepID=UPI00188119B6|nr:glycosyltransferase family 1 protein [aff. Roholtiella sp. LEGE 12411]MBE9035239.1 glycosyltransferase family 4 protein [aff. Roholtiella sp. LEGE 12411]